MVLYHPSSPNFRIEEYGDNGKRYIFPGGLLLLVDKDQNNTNLLRIQLHNKGAGNLEVLRSHPSLAEFKRESDYFIISEKDINFFIKEIIHLDLNWPRRN